MPLKNTIKSLQTRVSALFHKSPNQHSHSSTSASAAASTSKNAMHGHVKVHSVPIHSHVKHSAQGLLAHDLARAQKLIQGLHPHGPLQMARHRGHHGTAPPTTQPDQPQPIPPQGDPDAAAHSVDVTDAGVTYTTSVGVGSPAQEFTLLIDTGSSNTWVGASTKYKPGSTSVNTRNQVTVTYGSGSFSGSEFKDTVTLGQGLVIEGQSIGVASKATGFQGVDGILGIGPVDLTTGTVTNTSTVPTVTDNLFSQKTIATESIGISFEPTGSNALNGELSFGKPDSSKFTGEITFTPITSTSPASQYWGIDQTITYGEEGKQLLQSAGIVDTGTTLLLIATDAFQAYQKATGATMDRTTGLLTVTEAQFEKMESMFFEIAGNTFEFTPNAQIWPRSQNAQLGGQEGKIYIIVADLGNKSGQGLDFINGFAWLQRFYSVYDTTNAQVGIATTAFTQAETN